MTPHLPAQFATYSYESVGLTWFVVVRRIVAVLSIAAWIAFPLSWLDTSSALMPVWSFLAAVLSLAAYGAIQQFRPSYRCKECRRQMAVVDTPVQPQEINRFTAGSSYKQGPDGWLYHETTPENEWERVLVSRLAHRWYVCHHCRRFFLAANKILVRVDSC